MSDESLRVWLGKAIRKARKGRGLKQIDLANKLGVSSSHICEIESGRKSPSVFMLNDIEKIVGSVWGKP